MTEKEKRLETLQKTIQRMKNNQKLIMGILTKEFTNGLQHSDLNVVKWGYQQRFKQLQREVQRINKQ